MKRKTLENIFVAVILAAFAFLICMMSPTNLWEHLPIETDSGVFRYVALAMSKGEAMYKDCFDHKGPLIYFLNYLGMSLSYYKGIWVVEVLFMLGTVSGIYKIARMFCGKIFSCAAVFIIISSIFKYFEGGNFTEEYAMPLILWSLYIFLDYFLNKRVSGLRILLCGSMFAGVVMLRANMAAVWIVFCAAVLIQKLFNKEFPELLKFAGWFLGGFLIVTVPITAYLCAKGAFSFFIKDYFLFNFAYSDFNTISSRLSSYITFLNSLWVFASLGISLYVLAAEKDRKKKYIYGAYFVFMICSIILVCMPGNNYLHYGMTLIPVFVLPIAQLLGYLEERGKENKLWYFMMYGCIVLLIPTWMHELEDTINNYYSGAPYDYVRELELTIDTVVKNSTPDDEITVWGSLDSIYVYTNRLSASRYSYQYPIAVIKPEIYDEYFEDLEQHLPKLVVTANHFYGVLDFSRMQDFLQIHHYELVQDATYFKVYSYGQ